MGGARSTILYYQAILSMRNGIRERNVNLQSVIESPSRKPNDVSYCCADGTNKQGDGQASY